MTPHGLEGTCAQAFFQTRAGLAPAGGFQHRLADTEAAILQAEEIDSGNCQVASEIGRR